MCSAVNEHRVAHLAECQDYYVIFHSTTLQFTLRSPALIPLHPSPGHLHKYFNQLNGIPEWR